MNEAVAALGQTINKYDRQAVLEWSARIDNDAVKASEFWAKRFGDIHLGSPSQRQSILEFFGSDDASHPFHMPGSHWLTLHEPQVTKALAIFLDSGDDRLKRAFVTALLPANSWKDKLNNIRVSYEVQTSKQARIDILLRGMVEDKRVSLVVEVKFEHHSNNNPFTEYRNFVKKNHCGGAADALECVLLGLPANRARKKKNIHKLPKHWQFIEWKDFLRRFELEIIRLRRVEHYSYRQEYNFRQLRRIIWEMI